MMLLCICCTCFLLWFLYLPCIFTWLFCPCRLPGYEAGGVVVEVFPCRLPAYVAGGVVVETTTRAAVFFLPLCAAFFLFSLWAAVFSWAKLVTSWAHLGLFFFSRSVWTATFFVCLKNKSYVFCHVGPTHQNFAAHSLRSIAALRVRPAFYLSKIGNLGGLSPNH